MKRLFTINGPTQMLNILTQIESSKSEEVNYEDYLAIYYLDSKEKNPYIHDVIEKMSSIHKWKKIVLFEGQINLEEDIYFKLGVNKNDIEELYLVRNWTNNNEMFQSAFPQARVVIYGDFLGLFDSIVSPSYKIDKVNLILPIISLYDGSEKDILDRLEIIPKEHIYTTLNKLLVLFKSDIYKEKNITLFISSYFSKAYFMSLTEEIESYYDFIEKNHNKKELLILKPHPRDTGEVVNGLFKKLKENGYLVKVIEDSLKAIPIEMLIYILEIKTIIGTISGAFSAVKFLEPNIKIVFDNLSEVHNYKFTDEIIDGLRKNIQLIEKTTTTNNIIYLDSKIDNRKQIFSKDRDVEDLLELIFHYQKNNKEIVAYGAGGRFVEFIDVFTAKGINIKFIVDSNSEKEGNVIANKEVISKYAFQQISKRKDREYFIIILSSYSEDIIWFLNSLGYKKYIDFIEI